MKAHKMSAVKKKEASVAYAFLTPLFIGIVIFFIVPIFQSFYYSLTNWKGVGTAEFIGLKNYIKLFTRDDKFLLELRNTFVYVIGSVPLTIFFAFLIANLLNGSIRGTSFYKVIYFLPNVMMGTAAALVFRWLFNSRYGLVDTVLDFLFGIRPMWLTDTSLTMVSMCILSIWSGMGYCIIIILSGLKNIDPTYYEAAQLDGANAVQKFSYVTTPMVTPSIFYLMITRIIGAFNQFEYVYMLGEKGPVQNSLRTLVFGIYESGFQEFNMGYACSKAVILFIIIMTITLIEFRSEKLWVNY